LENAGTVQFEGWNKTQLIAECRRRNLPATGTTDVLKATLLGITVSPHMSSSLPLLQEKCTQRGLSIFKASGIGNATKSELCRRLDGTALYESIEKEGVKAILLNDGGAVGFVGDAVMHLWGVNRLDGLLLKVVDKCTDSASDSVRRESYRVGGKCACEVLDTC